MKTATIRREDVELLAPAGDWDCMRSAVANGADAIFFGVEKFNARARANNFRMDEPAGDYGVFAQLWRKRFFDL